MVIVPSTWQPSTAYAASTTAYVEPTAAGKTALLYRAKVGGATGVTEPAWPRILGQTVVDGTVTWVAAAIAPLITKSDLEDRLTRKVLTRICDDNRDGFADRDPVARLCWDATTYVMGLIGGVFDFPIGSPVPNELVRIALDVAEAYAAKRHPSVVRVDWKLILEQATRELKELRVGLRSLDTPPMSNEPSAPAPTPPKARNVGGIVYDNSQRMVVDSADGTNNNTLL
jgi:phage gp36-like protein